MLLGKRPRPPIKRTTSMTGITVDVSNMDSSESSDHHLQPPPNVLPLAVPQNINVYDQRFLSMVSPRNLQINNNNNNEFMMETSHFLRACGLCNRRLAPGRDIYMYRGDTAFCSLECREKKMKQDERREKLSASSSSSPPPGPRASTASGESEPVAAA
ncbi:FCS-Like Zinc finger 5-like [Mangifera indica]|uniref:FCS-Like Zinc finger 5-like n=1 Tax=Mangifera indica TaxID=29780 RepID=UPI001CF99E10|nr:FCS-Like Zinc finger 5-like [Mangifera indica]XP_044470615.1 FCS-Like Zinc finger 5-like [Mangifera indica]